MWFPKVTNNKDNKRISKTRRIKNIEREKYNVTSKMLPNELTICIATSLDTRSFFSLAATCHELYDLLSYFYKIAKCELRDIVFECVSKKIGLLFGGAIQNLLRNDRSYDYDFLFPKRESKKAALDCLKINPLIVMTCVCASTDSKKLTYSKVNSRSRYPNLQVDTYMITNSNLSNRKYVTILGNFVVRPTSTQKICYMISFLINVLINLTTCVCMLISWLILLYISFIFIFKKKYI